MRRGHPGVGGWRNDNSRHFRPRNGGNQHFRPSRGYSLVDQHRFPPPSSRTHRPSRTYKQRSSSDEHTRHDQHDRGKYRSDYKQNTYLRNQEERHQHQDEKVYPMLRHFRPSETSFVSHFSKEPPNYYESSSKHFHMNNLGDIDDRYIPPRDNYRQHPISPWENVNQYDDRPQKLQHNKSYKYDSGDVTKLPLFEYTGHRPPSNDHYGGNPTPVINNSESFNRSVDDTVNIVRKRLLNRNDPHSDTIDNNFGHPTENPTVESSTENAQEFQQEQSARKHVHRRNLSDKSSTGASVTKIRSKIVNQLFKMDKEKIHKLMDNPNSSSKFEYAISSLITESQYSFNRHLRSVAEKSLNTSSSIDFIQNDSNTIYEDTFMKQMQCILDPQDTVILEDIKPIVMAELSKALQLDEFEQRLDVCEEEVNYQQRYEEQNYNEYYDNQFNNYSVHTNTQYTAIPEQKHHPEKIECGHSESEQVSSEVHNYKNSDENSSHNNEVHFEARSRRSQHLSSDRDSTLDTIPFRKSVEDRVSQIQFATNAHSELEIPFFDTKSECQPLFVPNMGPNIEDEDDPFAELDKQYHVAVDHSFIDNEDSSSLHLEKDNSQPSNTNIDTNIPINLNTSEKELLHITQEIENQLHDIALSPLKLPLNPNDQTKTDDDEISKNLLVVKQERKSSCENQSSHVINNYHIEKPNEEAQYNEFNELKKEIVKTDMPSITKRRSSKLSSRKRAIDQSPSHRKEKRKKTHHEPDKPIQNKNSLIHCNDTCSKFSKKDDKKIFPEKRTKRKESEKKIEQKNNVPQKKQKSSDSHISSLSPKEINNTVSNSKLHAKEVKTALKTFDIFTEQPKKLNIHQAHRNTSLPSLSSVKQIPHLKTKQATNITKVHTSVQAVKKTQSKESQTMETKTTCSRFSQTDKSKYITTATQTDPTVRKSSMRSTDALERMKEIDLEIQVLLQEKFKLYSSIETGDSGTNSLQNLGMAVVNVTPSEDTIVEELTNIPAEEIEQVALESVEVKQSESSRPETRNRRLKACHKDKSKLQSPVPVPQKKNNKKTKTPNIPPLEEIVSDDKPIDEIIPLDDLEDTSVKTRAKSLKTKKRLKKKAPVKSKASSPPKSGCNEYVLKECTVLVIREDFRKYFSDSIPHSSDQESLNQPPTNTEPISQPQNNIPDEPIVNDIHFDMLDVSEDIVIGDVCEIKSVEYKEESDAAGVSMAEDIILDNSQSSLEDHHGSNSDSKENECKMFDYSEDENLQRDSVTVTGNADAVLAIEWWDNLSKFNWISTTTTPVTAVKQFLGVAFQLERVWVPGYLGYMRQSAKSPRVARQSQPIKNFSIVKFECIENNFIAACLNGNVYYFSADGQLITTLRGSNLAVTCLTIVKEKYGTTVYTGSLDSRIRYYDLDTGLEKGPECNVLSPIQTMDRAWDTIFVGTRTGFVLQFECKNNMLIPVSTVQFSDQSILALRAMKEGPRKVLLVAARSEDVTIKDAQTGLLLRTLAGPKMTVYTLLYEDGKVYCGTSSSQVHVYDYSSGSHVGAHEGGKGAVCLRAAGGLLFAGCYDGCVYVYREGERRPFAQLRGPGLMLLSLAVLGSKIIAGYKDRSLYIWKIPLSILQEMIL